MDLIFSLELFEWNKKLSRLYTDLSKLKELRYVCVEKGDPLFKIRGKDRLIIKSHVTGVEYTFFIPTHLFYHTFMPGEYIPFNVSYNQMQCPILKTYIKNDTKIPVRILDI